MDATYIRAIDGGAESLEEPQDTAYGDRRGIVGDNWGNIWQIASYRGDNLAQWWQSNYFTYIHLVAGRSILRE